MHRSKLYAIPLPIPFVLFLLSRLIYELLCASRVCQP